MDKQARIKKLRNKIELANVLLKLVEMERSFAQKVIDTATGKIEKLGG